MKNLISDRIRFKFFQFGSGFLLGRNGIQLFVGVVYKSFFFVGGIRKISTRSLGLGSRILREKFFHRIGSRSIFSYRDTQDNFRRYMVARVVDLGRPRSESDYRGKKWIWIQLPRKTGYGADPQKNNPGLDFQSKKSL